MACLKPVIIQNKYYNPKKFKCGEKYRHRYYEVPCGKCINCMATKANELSAKMKYNYYYKYDMKGIFITLTYADTQVPLLYVDKYDEMQDASIYEKDGKSYAMYDEDGKMLRLDYKGYPIETLRRKDFMLFMKKFRKEVAKLKICNNTLSFVACSEYGSRGERPHYHAVILGIMATEEIRQIIRKCWANERGQIGLIDVKGLEGVQGISYVTKYTIKELNWSNQDEREKPKVWHSINLERAMIEKEGMEKIKANNYKIQMGNDERNTASLGSYYIKKWHGELNKTEIYKDISKQLEKLHYEKSNEQEVATINGYTIQQIREYQKQVAEIQQRERMEKLEKNGEKFPRTREIKNENNETILNVIENIRNEEKEEIEKYDIF